MSDRPTEALQRRIDGEGQGLMFRDGKPETMRPVPISELRDAVDTIAALTAEVERLREACKMLMDYEYGDPHSAPNFDTVCEMVRAALTPPAPATCPECNGPADQGFSRDVPPVPYSCSKCEPEQPAPEDNLWRPCPDCTGKTACDCHLCWGRGRVRATEDENAVSGEGGG